MTAAGAWQFDLTQMPVNEPILVFLAEKLVGSRIHTAQRMRIANGYLTAVATLFADGAPAILAWRTMVDNPKEEITT